MSKLKNTAQLIRSFVKYLQHEIIFATFMTLVGLTTYLLIDAEWWQYLIIMLLFNVVSIIGDPEAIKQKPFLALVFYFFVATPASYIVAWWRILKAIYNEIKLRNRLSKRR